MLYTIFLLGHTLVLTNLSHFPLSSIAFDGQSCVCGESCGLGSAAVGGSCGVGSAAVGGSCGLGSAPVLLQQSQ